MTLDDMLIWFLLIGASILIISFAMLIYTAALLLHVRHKIREFESPRAERNGDWMARKRQERE